MRSLSLLAVLAVVVLVSGAPTVEDGDSNRIVGGVVAPITAHPYLAGIVINYLNVVGSFACGGSLLNTQRVLTAAHCYRTTTLIASRMTVVLGSEYLFHSSTERDVTGVAVHPNYVAASLANDVAVLYLASSVVFSNTIQPIQLPAAESAAVDLAGHIAVASGYGMHSEAQVTSSTVVRQVVLQLISEDQCRAAFPSIASTSNICTSGVGGVGICHGDSGGPLVITINGIDILVGVSSFVSSTGCDRGNPSGFAKVSSFVSWIEQHL